MFNLLEPEEFKQFTSQAFDFLIKYVKLNQEIIDPASQFMNLSTSQQEFNARTENLEWQLYVDEIYSRFFRINSSPEDHSIASCIKCLFEEIKRKEKSSVKTFVDSINIYKSLWSKSSVSFERNLIKCFDSLKLGKFRIVSQIF